MDYYATYSLVDNRIRLYAGRLPREEFDALRKAGWTSAPRQGYFFTAWSTYAEDLLAQMFGITELEDEDSNLQTTADDRAARFGTYSENATARAAAARKAEDQIAKFIPPGQPILMDHHSAAHALRDRDRMWRLADKQVEEGKRAAYWAERAKAVVAHAERRERPDVVARRIKTLEADLRKFQRNLELCTCRHEDITTGLISASADDTELYAKSCLHWQRWIDHTEMRLEYERALLQQVGGLLVDKPETPKLEVGGAVKFIGSWYTIKRVNKVSVTITGWFGIPDMEYKVPFDDIKGVRSKREWEDVSSK